MGQLFVLLTWLQQLFHLYLGRLANFASYLFKILVSMKDDRLIQTANYVVTTDFTVISGFQYLFFDVFCVPGVGTLNLI